jgi:beta-glucosidase
MKFNKEFKWGAATASYQIEGAYNQDGRGLSIWDTFSSIKGNVLNGDTGNKACDHYNKLQEDIELMKEIGLETYRFSIAWPRIFPLGKGKVNQKGLDFYNKLIDGLLEAGIEPAITLYHWDLPQALQDKGGWESKETVDAFVDYAEVIFKAFGDRVNTWITHNEPFVVAFHGNSTGDHAPGIKNHLVALKVAHNLLVSHGLVVRKFREMDITGDIGITLNLSYAYTVSDSKEDSLAADLFTAFYNGWFLDPIFKGYYPKNLVDIYKEKYENIDFLFENLDVINEEIDFLGINYYSRGLVEFDSTSDFFNIKTIKPEESNYTAMNWEIYPKGLYDLLINISKEYTDLPLYITENGAAFNDEVVDGIVNDTKRIEFLKGHFKSAYDAIQSGVNLQRYYVWSLMDNFEWAYGYSKRFGIIFVDYSTKERILKNSAHWYKEVIKNNCI